MTYQQIAIACVVMNVLVAIAERSWPNAVIALATAAAAWWEYRHEEALQAAKDRARSRASASSKGSF